MKTKAEQLRALQFAKDEYGNRKMSSDPGYRKAVEKEFEKVYPGSGKIVDPKIVRN